MLNEIERLKQAPQTEAHKDLIRAGTRLCRLEYERYRKNQVRADQSLQLLQDVSSGMYSIQCIDLVCHDGSSLLPQYYSSPEADCNCVESVAHEGQCKHKILLCYGFFPEEFKVRHFRRIKVIGSLRGWQPVHPSAEVHLLSYEETSPNNDDGLSGSPDFLNDSLNDTQVGASLLDIASNITIHLD